MKRTVKTPRPEDLRKRSDTMQKKAGRPLKGSAGKLARAKTLRGTDEKIKGGRDRAGTVTSTSFR